MYVQWNYNFYQDISEMPLKFNESFFCIKSHVCVTFGIWILGTSVTFRECDITKLVYCHRKHHDESNDSMFLILRGVRFMNADLDNFRLFS